MSVQKIRSYAWVLAAITVLATATAGADEQAEADSTAPVTGEDSWYYRSAPSRTVTPSLAHQKAAVRGQQRMARLEAMRWYGFSNSRPTASGMPWTTMYSPAWQQPGGRPFAWYSSSRPVVIYTGEPRVYRAYR